MAVIPNSWVEKTKKKKEKVVASAKDDFETQTRKPAERHTPVLKVTMHKTLNGVRK